MRMSKVVLRQVLLTDMLRSVVDSCRESYRINNLTIPDETEIKLKRIERLNAKTINYALGKNRIDENGCYELDPEEMKRYAKSLQALDATNKQLCGDAIKAINYISTTLALCADQESTAPPGERRGHWFDICQTLQELFDEYEHDDAEIDAGVARSETIKRVMGW